MAEENGLDGDKNMQEDTTSTTFGLEIEQKTKKEDVGKTVPFYKLFSFADSVDALLMIVGTIGAVGNGLCFPLLTVLLGKIVNSFGQNQNNKDIVHIVSEVSLKFVYLGLCAGAAGSLQVSCWMVTGERQGARIRSLYLKALMRQDIAFFDTEMNTGEVISRMSSDILLIQNAMGEKVGNFIQLGSQFFGCFVIAFIKGWLLTLVSLSSIPPLAIAVAASAIFISKAASNRQNAYAKAAIVVEQTISSIKTVASFTAEKQVVFPYDKSLVDACKSGIQEGLATGFGLGAVMCVLFCAYSLAAWFGAKMISDKGYLGGDVLNVIFAVVSGSICLGQAAPCITAFASGKKAAFKVFEIVYRKPEIDAYDIKGKKLDDICGDIELRDVCFSYPSRPYEQIVNGFSISIPSGKITAIVGQSGSGKSTVINLVQRFYDPQSGQVLIDGINLKELQLRWVREKIGLVSQEPVLFTCSIKDNIAYGKDEASLEEIKVAAELANAATFIDKLPQGLDTMVGEHGLQLSGKQKQRVAIARAILKDPRILLLDEATSALDAESERIVQEALNKIMVNRTTIVVAHRLSTIRNAHIIAVVQQGTIVEKGSHLALLENPEGEYSKLTRLQEVNKDSERATMDLENSGSIIEVGQNSRSISHGSSVPGNRSRHLRVPFRLHKGINVPPNALIEGGASYNQSSKIASEFPLRRLAQLNKPEAPVLIAGSIFAVINGSILPIFGLLISEMLKTFFEPPNQLKKGSKFWALMFLVFGVASLIAYPARAYLFSVAGCKLIKRVRLMCFEKVTRMEVSWFDELENSSGVIGARLSVDAATVRALVGDALGQLVQDCAAAIAGLVISFIASWQLTLIVLALIPLIGLNGFAQHKFLQGFSGDAKIMYEEASQVTIDAIRNIRTVASFCAEEKVMELYKKKCQGPLKTGIWQGMVRGIGFGVSFSLLFFVYAGSFYSGAKLVEDEKTRFGDVLRVFFVLIITAMVISHTNGLALDSTKAKDAVASIFAILDRKSKIDPSDESGLTLENLWGEIELRHVSFKYPTRPDIQILHDLSLNIHSGKTVALVGESGSGKSTVIALLQRFYDPESGDIMLDGIEIQRLQLKWFRRQMGLVSQEPVLFNETVRANIAYGKEGNATEGEIIEASELANAHNFITGLQQGYDTMVGERGVQLSGGQKQRVAIARAIVKSPKILLLDEATSALDAESERVVQDALDKVMVNRTTIIVAHRLSTIKNADVIAVLKNGNIVEKGSHDTLIGIKDGVYSSLYMSASSS